MEKETKEIVTVYVTKYALTAGIFSIKAEIKDGYACEVTDEGGYKHYAFFLGKSDYSFTFEEAVEKAKAIRDKKLKSIEKQVKKLQNMKFELVSRKESNSCGVLL